jgi:hypothetical protein
MAEQTVMRDGAPKTAFVVWILSQPIGAAAQPASNSSQGAANIAAPISLLSNKEFWLTTFMLVFGLVIILIEYMLVRNRMNEKIEDFSKFFVLTLIIIGTLVLIGSGLSNDQIAPAVGLFGTIAGYLLGRSERPGSPDKRGGDDAKPV